MNFEGDPELAKIMRRLKIKPPIERIVTTDWMATALNRDKLGLKKRIVILECSHYTATTNAKTAPCRQCHKMILNGEDYEKFRNR